MFGGWKDEQEPEIEAEKQQPVRWKKAWRRRCPQARGKNKVFLEGGNNHLCSLLPSKIIDN
jgi:hypothetical protein